MVNPTTPTRSITEFKSSSNAYWSQEKSQFEEETFGIE